MNEGNFNTVLMDAVIDGFDKYKSMAEQVIGSDKVQEEFAKIIRFQSEDHFEPNARVALPTLRHQTSRPVIRSKRCVARRASLHPIAVTSGTRF